MSTLQDEHEPETCEDDHESPLHAWLRSTPPARAARRARRAGSRARTLWRERDAQTIAAVHHVHHQVLADEPRLRSVVEHDLLVTLEGATPLNWRLDDLRWSLVNARRALCGRLPLRRPWDEMTTVEASRTDIERNLTTLRAERLRTLVDERPPKWRDERQYALLQEASQVPARRRP